MGLLTGNLKLNAAVRSMHQFCPVVRAVFPEGEIADDVVEAATVYFYVEQADEVFGRKFAARLERRLRDGLRFATPEEIQRRIASICRRADEARNVEDDAMATCYGETEYQQRIKGMIRALLQEAGWEPSDAELVRATFMRLEDAVGRIREHLAGIKRQNDFVLKR